MLSLEGCSEACSLDVCLTTSFVVCNVGNTYAMCNEFHNILRLLDDLPNFLFTTSETMGDYYL